MTPSHSSDSPRSGLRERLEAVGLIFRKELLEVRRDSRSLLFMLVLPMAAFPLVLTGVGLVAERGMSSLREQASVVAVGGDGAAQARALLETLAVGPDGTKADPSTAPSDLGPVLGEAVERLRQVEPEPTGALQLLPRHVRTVSVDEGLTGEAAAEQCLGERTCDAVLWLDEAPSTSIEDGAAMELQIYYNSSRDRSTLAQQRVSRLFTELGDFVVEQRLQAWGRSPSDLKPFAAQSMVVGEQRSLLVDFMSYIMILMAFMGALYPAIDLTAGEKERGTLETLLVTPAHRGDLVVGKFLVVALAGCLSAALSGLGLMLSMYLGLLPAALGSSLQTRPEALLWSVLLLLPTACIFAALLLALSIFARSFKEAQSYATPLHLLILLPAAVGMVPGVELTFGLSLVPVVNTALGIRELWGDGLGLSTILWMLASSLAFAGVALYFCFRWFHREEVLFRS